jgi:branched-chain amino acid transport system ATP-binding protein
VNALPSIMGSEPLLRVENLDVSYGSVQVVRGVSLSVPNGQVVAVIGSNGAGKSTTLNAIAGVLPTRGGRIVFKRQDLARQPPHERVKRRITLVPEGRQLWPKMTVQDNLLMGAFPSTFRHDAYSNLDRVYGMFPRLKERRHQLAGTLSGGEQQMCALGRGMMSQPELLMLDEPSLGLAPKVVDEIFAFISSVTRLGVTILLVAQNVDYALRLSQYAYVMETGRITIEGPSQDLLANDYVRQSYLGVS